MVDRLIISLIKQKKKGNSIIEKNIFCHITFIWARLQTKIL